MCDDLLQRKLEAADCLERFFTQTAASVTYRSTTWFCSCESNMDDGPTKWPPQANRGSSQLSKQPCWTTSLELPCCYFHFSFPSSSALKRDLVFWCSLNSTWTKWKTSLSPVIPSVILEGRRPLSLASCTVNSFPPTRFSDSLTQISPPPSPSLCMRATLSTYHEGTGWLLGNRLAPSHSGRKKQPLQL